MMIKRAVQLSGVATGGQIQEAANGKLALETLASTRVDLVLADLHMPEMTGVEMTGRMLADPKLRSIPVVVVSAEPNIEKLEQLKSQGVRGFIRKPFTPEAIRKVITDVLGVYYAA
jgi:two-component system chemotaxis response regulator CheY